MVRTEDIVYVDLDENERAMARTYAKQAELGGMSNVRGRAERQQLLGLDQFIGVGLGEMAGNKYFYNATYYCLSRERKNARGRESDGGCDTLNFKIDYKTSRGELSRLLSYHLPVRPREWHEDHVYVFILVDTLGCMNIDELVESGRMKICLVGWATTAMLPRQVTDRGTFRGAYILRANQLQPIATLYRERIKKDGY